MVLIYSQHITSRLQYIAKFMFEGILQVKAEITSNKNEFEQYTGPKINYSFEELAGIQVIPSKLLFSSGIEDINVEVVWKDNLPLLFHTCADVPLSFDPFAASFYMITRYEEYVNKTRDSHGRFLAKDSLAAKHGFVNLPVVDHWAFMVRDTIKKYFPTFEFPKREYRFIPTIDVDSVALFKGKPFTRLLGATIKSILRIDTKDLKARYETWIMRKPDPLDTFEKLDGWHDSLELKPKFFFLVGEHSRFDGNLSPNSLLMQETVDQVAQKYEVGIHPSYYSFNQKSVIKQEVTILEELAGKKVTISRQHFLRMEFPETYRNLISIGIKEDYTLGFSDMPGFRAGTCTSFNFYDIENEYETELQIHPLVLMDASMLHYMKLSPQQSLETAMQLVNAVKEVQGTFILLWHNSFIVDSWKSKGWENVYPQLIKEASL